MGKYGNGIKVSDGNGNGMGMGMKSLKWEGIGTKNLFPHTSSGIVCGCLCDPTFCRFSRTPACDRQRHGHRPMASTEDA